MRVMLIVAAALALSGTVQQSGKGEGTAVPILVELFTSEGCSSCPPADALLERMLVQQPDAGVTLVGLGEHVDYWDGSGWRDRFSSSAFTRRQQQYAAHSGNDDVYTPQMIVDGGDAFVGSDGAAARRAIERAGTRPHGEIHLTVDPHAADTNTIAIAVDIRSLPPAGQREPADLVVAVTEDGLQTDVKHGENQGRALTHAAVVRDLVTVGQAAVSSTPLRTTIRMQPEWRREALKVVAFVQQRRSLHVIATAVQPVESRR